MTAPRRRLIRSHPVVPETQRRNQQALERSENRLENERIVCRRWLSKLKRALRAVDKSLSYIGRLEKTISSLRQV